MSFNNNIDLNRKLFGLGFYDCVQCIFQHKNYILQYCLISFLLQELGLIVVMIPVIVIVWLTGVQNLKYVWWLITLFGVWIAYINFIMVIYGFIFKCNKKLEYRINTKTLVVDEKEHSILETNIYFLVPLSRFSMAIFYILNFKLDNGERVSALQYTSVIPLKYFIEFPNAKSTIFSFILILLNGIIGVGILCYTLFTYGFLPN